uniref:Armadillo repeat-containing protein 6 n=1 Tax=Schistocephalus solidus TaxID=70667 RepID=A0A183T6L4_SCHSO
LSEKGLALVEHYMFEEHEQLRCAATECFANLALHHATVVGCGGTLPLEEYALMGKKIVTASGSERVKLLMLFCLNSDDIFLLRAASGALAAMSYDPGIIKKITEDSDRSNSSYERFRLCTRIWQSSPVLCSDEAHAELVACIYNYRPRNSPHRRLRSPCNDRRRHAKELGPLRRYLRQLRYDHQHETNGGHTSGRPTLPTMHQLQAVDTFNYLGSTLARSTKIDGEVTHPIASQTFGCLQILAWSHQNLYFSTKLKVYKAVTY